LTPAPFHPARIALVVLAAVAVLIFIFGARVRGGARRVKEIYRKHFSEAHRERQLVAAIAFYVTFAVVRILTHAIRAGRGPFHDLSVSGRHIHHLVWGILLLLVVGYGWLLEFGADTPGKTRWSGRSMALLFGVGAALTLDEFALWLNLADVYWERQGRASIDAVVLFGALLAISAAGGRFLRALAREALGRR
jgi:hypothetical protein